MVVRRGTEYAAQHVQVKQKLMPIQQFLDVIGSKMRNADIYDKSLSFTEMSKTCLDKNKTQYGNVYQKGALINMCLDLKLRVLSDGKYGTQDLMRDLSKKFGINKPFNDKCLFKEIGKMTGYRKEMKDFFKRYVAGTASLPIKELVAKAGITYQEKGIVQQLSPFGFDPQRSITLNVDKQLLEIIGAGIDGFGKDILGLKGGDLIKDWNGKEVSLASVQAVLGEHAMSAKEGDMLIIKVLRKNESGEYEEVELSGELKKMPIEERHAFKINEKPSEQEMKIRKSWLGDYSID